MMHFQYSLLIHCNKVTRTRIVQVLFKFSLCHRFIILCQWDQLMSRCVKLNENWDPQSLRYTKRLNVPRSCLCVANIMGYIQNYLVYGSSKEDTIIVLHVSNAKKLPSRALKAAIWNIKVKGQQQNVKV